MIISGNDSFLRKFEESFPGFNGGMRELRLMVGVFRIDIDTYQNPLFQVKRHIGIHLQSNNSFVELQAINKYLKESKVDIDTFDFIGESRSQLWLIEQQIANLLQEVNISNDLLSQMTFARFRTKEKLIFFVDWISFTYSKKDYVINTANLVSSYIREVKYLDWFDDDTEKVVSADDYFRKKYPYSAITPFFERFSDIEDIRILFYNTRTHTAQRRLDFQSIRALFNNRKARKNENRKQCNFSLSLAADRNIDKLANDGGVTRSVVVDMVFKNIKNWHKLQD